MGDKWQSYVEAAAVLGMSVEGVRQRARREHWRKQLGNDGRALILVPEDAGRAPGGNQDGEAAPTRPVAGRKPAGDEAGLRAMLAEMEAKAAELRADLDRERSERDRERAELKADVERERAERLRERDRADKLTGEVADLARQLAKVVEEAAGRDRDLVARAMKAESEIAALRAAPWWRRLWVAA